LRGYFVATLEKSYLLIRENIALQSPCGAILLQQHTPLSAVLYRALEGGIYENCQLSTGCLWITLQKVRFVSMDAYKAALLDFLWRCYAMSMARTLCQEARWKVPTPIV
jgi:hypothetical protein